MTVNIQIPVSEETRRKFKMACTAKNTTMSEELRQAVDDYIHEHELEVSQHDTN